MSLENVLSEMSFQPAPQIFVRPPGPRSRQLLAQQNTQESNARTYPRGLPIALADARGATLKDVDGNTFIDCLSGAGALNVGHNNPFVIEEVQRYLGSGQVLTGLDFPTPNKQRFINALFQTLPAELRQHGRIQFCGPTGSDAVDAAVKLAKIFTRRHEVVAFQGAYHGMGQGPLSMMGNTAPKSAVGALLPGVHFAPYAYCGRCALKLSPENCGLACAHMLGSMLEDTHSGITRPAAIIVEPVQGEGGCIVPAPGWLAQIAAYAQANDVPLIVDEVQSGMGRTGKWFAFEHENIVPDILILSKSLGGIGFPLAVIVYHERLDKWKPGDHTGTFRGNQVAMAAGAAAIEFMRSHLLVEHAARIGELLLQQLREGLHSHPLVVEARGRGLMIGIEMASPVAARAVRSGCLQEGLIVELGGRQDSVVRLLPPLVLTEVQARRVARILQDTISALPVEQEA